MESAELKQIVDNAITEHPWLKQEFGQLRQDFKGLEKRFDEEAELNKQTREEVRKIHTDFSKKFDDINQRFVDFNRRFDEEAELNKQTREEVRKITIFLETNRAAREKMFEDILHYMNDNRQLKKDLLREEERLALTDGKLNIHIADKSVHLSKRGASKDKDHT